MTTKPPTAGESPASTPPKGATTRRLPTTDRPRAERPVVLAAVIGAHGVGGEVRLKVFADDLAAHRSFNDGALTLTSLRGGNNGAIARFTEVKDRTAAEGLRGTELTVPRSALPALAEGEYYHADLLGLPAEDSAGVALGTIVAVDNFGAGDVIEIERANGKRFMVPMRPEAVPQWDGERLVVDPAFVEP